VEVVPGRNRYGCGYFYSGKKQLACEGVCVVAEFI
jgi:hypothetical protein